ncbi:MAG: hypothetical protein GWN58_53245, partial [Anaerolineae bacterium]|nr:hypothetical protein [Anaerolineae bacterium]
LIENPVLEEEAEESESLDESYLSGDSDTLAEDGDVIEDHHLPENDIDWQQYLASGSGVIPERSHRDGGDDYNLEATISNADTLNEHLLWQLEMAPITPLEMTVGRHLIGNLDDDGYLMVSIR